MTYILGNFVKSPLTGEKNGRGEHALHNFAADAFVEPFDAFFFEDGEQSVEGRFVLQSIGLACLKPALYNTAFAEMSIPAYGKM